jgi:peptide/nickel transport system substrate-binding protein
LNSGTSAGNTAYNARAVYPTGAGYTYYDDQTNLVMNTKFGKMSIVKNTPSLFSIKYTVVKNQKWSDGTPIDAVDLLLSHVIASDGYSKSAGLGDPASDTPAFDSVGYGGAYGSHVIGLPVLSADHYSLTVNFDQPMVDWQLLAPGPTPVHALEMLAANKKPSVSDFTTSQYQSDALAAKAAFLDDFTNKNTSDLTKMGDVWTSGYNLANITSNTNPLLLLSNGGFKVASKVDGTSLTLVKNPLYKSGPAFVKTTAPVNTLVFKVIQDNTAAVQALQNKNIDIYTNTLPKSADKITLSGTSGVTVRTDVGGSYSIVGLRTGARADGDVPTGPFAGNSKRAKDLRHAFLLALPRQQFVDNLVAPVDPTAKTMDTDFAFRGTNSYNSITAASGTAEYSAGTQADRTAQALALVQKWYPTASATDSKVTIKMLHAGTSSLRNSMAALIVAEEKKAGFSIVNYGSADMFSDSDGGNDGVPDFYDPQYDVSFHGFSITAVTQGTATAEYQSDGGNNEWGWANSKVDVYSDKLQSDVLSDADILKYRTAIAKIAHDNYWGLPLYQNPTLTAYNTAVANVKPEPIGYDVVWNYWEWHF